MPRRLAQSWRVIALCVGLVVIGLAIAARLNGVSLLESMRFRYEIVRVGLSHNAALAVRYGDRHFDADHAETYNIPHAFYLYNIALGINPNEAFAHHQLARIYFLAADYENAMQNINLEFVMNPQPSPSSYYVRALIEGFMGTYDAAARDYEAFLRTDPKNWAAINDYAWVLLKANRPKDALIALDWGLMYNNGSPWLHNSRATALFELGRTDEAYQAALEASRLVGNVAVADWLKAYPGNDPLIAPQGVAAFKKAIADNLETIELAMKKE